MKLSDKLLKELKRSGVSICLASEIERPAMIRTGWPSLDMAIEGIPRGRLTYIWGEKGAGKSTLCYSIASSYSDLGWTLYVDAERSYDQEWASNFVDTKNMYVMRPEGGGEALLDAIKILMRSDDPPVLIVIDSLTSMINSRAIDRDSDKMLVGIAAMFNNRFVRVINSLNKNTAVVIVGQYREGIGSWNYTPGGNGILHLASLIIKMRGSPLRAKDSDLSDGDPKQQVGVLSRWLIQKNKQGRQT